MVIILGTFLSHGIPKAYRLIIAACLCVGALIVSVSGAGYSEDYIGYIGDTIDLHGVSYTGDQIYLFMTGPGLPENGVTLTDTSQKTDQGDFTTVGVDSTQHWAYKWNTFKLRSQIDPGTYYVYAVNAPVGKSDLAGHSYQSMRVDLKDETLSPDYVSSGTRYTVNLADENPDVTYTVRTTITTVPLTTPPVTTTIATTIPTSSPAPVPTTKKSPVFPMLALAGIVLASGMYLLFRSRNPR